MRRLRADDAGLWRRAMRDVAPLRDTPQHNPPPQAGEGRVEAKADGTPAVQAKSVRAAQPAAEALPPLDRFAGIDRATAERLKRGRYPVAARLDLHGMTQAEAHRALAGFVAGSRAGGRRCLLVITGHGR